MFVFVLHSSQVKKHKKKRRMIIIPPSSQVGFVAREVALQFLHGKIGGILTGHIKIRPLAGYVFNLLFRIML